MIDLVRGLWRIIFLRGSPQRVPYVRRQFVVALLLAVVASAAVQWLFHQDHLVFIILRVFAEVTMFMLAMVLLTAKIARVRLAHMMFLLVLISLFADALLLLFVPLLHILAPADAAVAVLYLSYAAGFVACYGASSVMAWGLRKPLVNGVLVIAGYVGAVLAINLAFRGLYDIVAAG